MNSSRRSFLTRLATVSLLGLTTAPALAKKKKKKKKRKGDASELPRVTQVDSDSITVGGKYYIVPPNADVIVNGEEATMDDVKVGMQASVAGGVAKYGDTKADTIYKATRVVVRTNKKKGKKK